MKVFIIGGEGFIGSHVVKRLIQRGDEVRCLVSEETDTERIDGLEWEKYTGTTSNQSDVIEGAASCDAIIFLTTNSKCVDGKCAIDRSLQATRNVLEAGMKNGNIRLVYCSTVVAINGTMYPSLIDENSEFDLDGPQLSFAQKKHKAEQLCSEAFKNKNQNVVIVNPAEVYGPDEFVQITSANLIEFAKNWPVVVAKGGTSIVHVEDVANGILAALDRGVGGKRYILSGENVTNRELAELTLDILNKKTPIIQLPVPIIKSLAWLTGAIRVSMPYSSPTIPYVTRYWMTDNARAKDELKVRFRSARETLQPTIRWLIETGKIPGKVEEFSDHGEETTLS